MGRTDDNFCYCNKFEEEPLPVIVTAGVHRCCERCSVPSQCIEIRTRWFCPICREIIQDWITHYQLFIEEFLSARGLM